MEVPATLKARAGMLAVMAGLIPCALLTGFTSAQDIVVGAGALAALLAVLGVSVTPFSLVLKLLLLMVISAFAQEIGGSLSATEARALNPGNFLLAALVGCYILNGMRRGSFYRPTPIDVWLAIAIIAVPVCSILHTATFGHVPGYGIIPQLLFYKRWVTPFICLFVVLQYTHTPRELLLFAAASVTITSLAMLCGAKETFEFSAWEDSRAVGILNQANISAGLIALISPFLFLALFLLKCRPLLKAACLVMLAFLGLSLLTTYSRAGYLGFLVALVGGTYAAYRGGGRIPLLTPVLLVGSIVAITVWAAPQVVESIEQRLDFSSYKLSKRRSQNNLQVMNQYSGDRLELWGCALKMASEKPLFGIGYRAYNALIPKYHRRAISNSPHSMYLGALAEGGIVWLGALLVFFWSGLRSLHQAWKLTLERRDLPGQVVCGGALVSFLVMLGLGTTSDFLLPGARGLIFWVLVAVAIKYGLLLQEQAAGPDGPLPSGPPAPCTSAPVRV